MRKFLSPLLAVLLGVSGACSLDDSSLPQEENPPDAQERLFSPPSVEGEGASSKALNDEGFDGAGRLVIDGSSTVFPITEAATREFAALAPDVRVHLGVSGTGGGFKKFCRGETDISDASRPIKDEEERLCRERGVEYVELPIAFDGISVVVNSENTWARCVTVDELRRLWEPAAEGHLLRWQQVRDTWPKIEIHLYGPGGESGTFDYFTYAIVGEEGQSRRDFTASEDDYLIAQDVVHDPQALGFFGLAYYREYQDRLRAVALDPGSGCVTPDADSINSGSYRPLSRPIFLYASLKSLERPEVERFLAFYLAHARRLVEGARYVPLPERVYTLATDRLRKRRTGSLFDGGSQVGLSIEALLELEAGNSGTSP